MPWKVTWLGSMFAVVPTGSAGMVEVFPVAAVKEYQSRCPPPRRARLS
jgi:hypothetical protein